MRYNTFLFDFDYTLVNSSAGIVQCFRTVLDNHEFTSPSDEDIKRTIGKTLEESFTILTGVDDKDTLHSYRQEFVKKADEVMTASTFLFPETMQVLTTLKENGAKLGIVSTKYKYRIKEFIDQNFPKDFFDIIIGMEEVKKYKPEPDGILKAINSLKSKKKKVVYIGDSTTDAQAAQNAEVDFIGVTHGVTTTRELACFQNVAIIPDLSPLLSLVNEKSITDLLHLNKCHTIKRYFSYRKHIGITKTLDPYKHYVCNNCGTYFTGEYCNCCGQRRNTRRFTFSYVIKNALGGLTNIDDGFLRNLVELMYRPGYMIYDYIKGKRSHYFKPFQTLFVLAAIYIILVKVTDPLAFMTSDNNVSYNSAKMQISELKSHTSNDNTKALLGKSYNYLDSAYTTALPEERSDIDNIKMNISSDSKLEQFVSTFIRTFSKILNLDAGSSNDNPTFTDGLLNVIRNWAKDNKALSLIMLIPLYAYATRRSFKKNTVSKELNYTEHLFVQVYIACQMVLISILLLPVYGHQDLDDAFGISWWIIFLLYWWDYHQLFKESWKKTLKKTILMFFYLSLIIMAIFIIISIIIGIWTDIFL